MFIADLSLKSFVQKLLSDVQDVLDYPVLNPVRELKREALKESTDYAREHMLDALPTYSNKQALRAGLDAVSRDGHYLEFGVFRGSTINFLGRQNPEKVIHGFDSFRGLPDTWSGTGFSFDLQGEMPRVPDNVKLYSGLFADTLPGWLERNPGPAAFVHIDCDIYSSTKTVFEYLGPERITHDTVIVFDEYFNYPGWKNHEYKAFQEFIASSGLSYSYLAYSRFQVVVKMK